MSEISEEKADVDLSSPQARALRLRRARNLANLSRKELCSGDDLNINTYKGWEIGRYGGLPQAGCSKVVERLAQEGVRVTAEWLMHGAGVAPHVQVGASLAGLANVSGSLFSQEDLIHNEILFFASQMKNSVHLIIADCGMEPFYSEGDYVMGVKLKGDGFDQSVGQNCIVELISGDVLCRRVRRGEGGEIHLSCLNLETRQSQPILYNVQLRFVAPVLWHRKPQLNGVVGGAHG